MKLVRTRLCGPSSSLALVLLLASSPGAVEPDAVRAGGRVFDSASLWKSLAPEREPLPDGLRAALRDARRAKRDGTRAKTSSRAKKRLPLAPDSRGRLLRSFESSRRPVDPGAGLGGGAGELGGSICTECLVGDASCDGPVNGALEEGDCLVDGIATDVWRLELAETSSLTLDLASTEFDTLMAVVDESCESIASNDDCTPGDIGLSCVSLTLPAGTYFVAATAFNLGATGSYTLTASCEPPPCATCDVETIACGGGPSSGALEGGDCPQSGGELLDLHRFELAESARIRATLDAVPFDPILILFDASCAEIARNDDCSPGNLDRSCLTSEIPAGTYYLGVTSFSSGETGAYELSLDCDVGFELCTDCVAGSLDGEGPHSVSVPVTDCTREGGQSLDLYRFELEADTPLSIELDSEIDTFLTLYDADCEPIAENDDCAEDNLDSCLSGLDLAAGTYFLGLSTFDPGVEGDVTIRIFDRSFCRDCTVDTAVCGETLAGDLAAGDCELDDDSRVDLWTLEIEEVSEVTIDLASTAFDTFLFLFDGSCRVIATNDDCPGGGTDSCVTTILPAGTYSIAVNSFSGGEEGAYSLTVGCVTATICSICRAGDIECGTPVSGRLEDGDCTLVDGTFVDAWAISLDRGQRLEINLSSDDLNAYVILFDAECNFLVDNDDCELSQDSCLTVDLPAGEYFIGANSLEPQSGAYTLSVDCVDIPLCGDCGVGAIACNETVEATFPSSGCRLGDDTDIDIYELDLPVAGTVDITLTSAGFDTYLLLFDGDCIVTADNDDCTAGDTTTSCLSLSLDAGSYAIGVNSFGPGESGDYSLTVSTPECVDCGECRVGSVACGENRGERLGGSGCTSSSGAPLDAFELVLEEGSDVTVSVLATDFDPLLTVLDSSCGVLAENDDCGDGSLNSCISRTLPAGTYLLAVSSILPDADGAYIVNVERCVPAQAATRVPGDCTSDGNLNITDGICLLNFLFLAAEQPLLPCGDGSETDPGNIALMDVNGDSGLNLSDAVFILSYLFLAGPAPGLGTECTPIQGCDAACGG